MENKCLITQYQRNLVVGDDSLRIGECKVSVFPNRVFEIRWNNFNSEKDSLRIISGSGSIVTDTNGYTVTAGSAGCVLAATNKYDITRLNGSGDSVCYEIDANQFEWCQNTFATFAKAKIKGKVNCIQENTINYFTYLDLSEADGYVDLAKATSFSLINPISSAFVTASGVFNVNLSKDYTFKKSEIPIPLAYIGSNIVDLLAQGLLFIGNIETDMPVLANLKKLRIDGNVTGALERWIEKLVAVKEVNSGIRVYSTSSMTLNGQTLIDANYLFHFNADTVTVEDGYSQTIIGTYTKATDTWSWV